MLQLQKESSQEGGPKMIYYEHAGGLFSAVAGYSHGVFSMPQQDPVAESVWQNRAFSGCIGRLAIAGSEQSSLRRLVSACSNMAFILYGTVCYGSN